MRGVLAYLMMVVVAGCGGPGSTNPDGEGDVGTGIRFLGAFDGADGYERAMVPRDFQFPQEHAAHPTFRTEWWYFTGNLRDARERPYGFELTFFRIALAPRAQPRLSAWGSNQVWMAHFAVTDPANNRFIARERLARGALGLAGATHAPLRIWVKDWSAEGDESKPGLALRLQARDQDTQLDLRVTAVGPPVAQGDRGLDAKGPEPGNASYYYSVPKLTAEGSITLDGRRIEVTGSAWMDREWSTSALSQGIVGWEWFALRLSDDRSLMFYRLRQADGNGSEFSGGSLIEADGKRRALGADDVELVPTGYWTSEVTAVRYAIEWRLNVPSADITLDIQPYMADQEVNLTVRYWEGAVRARGLGAEGALTAEGYLELAGY